MSFFSGPAQPNPVALPQAPAQPPMFGASPQGKKPTAKPSQPTYLGAVGATPQQAPGKTLLGQ